MALGLAAIAGCGRGISMAEVEGVVTLNGKPVEKIQVEFWPSKEGPRSIGVTDSEGRYKLKTDDGTQPGAAVGKHSVVLHDVGIFGDKFLGRGAEDVDISNGQKPRISSEYCDAARTTLQKEVVAGQKNQIDLQVNAWRDP
jgi:hypothetical protein